MHDDADARLGRARRDVACDASARLRNCDCGYGAQGQQGDQLRRSGAWHRSPPRQGDSSNEARRVISTRSRVSVDGCRLFRRAGRERERAKKWRVLRRRRQSCGRLGEGAASVRELRSARRSSPQTMRGRRRRSRTRDRARSDPRARSALSRYAAAVPAAPIVLMSRVPVRCSRRSRSGCEPGSASVTRRRTTLPSWRPRLPLP